MPDAAVTLEDLIDRYCETWTETDAAKRAALLESVWSTDGIYTDPTVAQLGKAELLDHIPRVQATRPGAKLRRTTTIDEHHGALRFGFEVTAPDGRILRHGVDFATVDVQSMRIRRIIGFFGDLRLR